MLRKLRRRQATLVSAFTKFASIPGLRRVSGQSDQGFYQLIMRLFGYSNVNYNYAQLRAVYHGLDPEVSWLCADPLRLTLDVAQAYAATAEGWQFDQAQLDECVAYLNSQLEGGYRVYAPTSTAWYLACPKPLSISVDAPLDFCGQSLLSHLPQGADGLQAVKLFNELQMLLHSYGQLSGVDALWLWGGGEVITPQKLVPWQSVISSDSTVLALADLHQITHYKFDAETDLSRLIEGVERPCLVVDTSVSGGASAYAELFDDFYSIRGDLYRHRKLLAQFCWRRTIRDKLKLRQPL